MTQQTKNLENYLIQKVQKEQEITDSLRNTIRWTVHQSFQEGYAECLQDVRNGLIK